MIYDILVPETYLDKTTGKGKTKYNRVGTAFDPKNGGPGCNGEPFANVGILGPFIVRPRKKAAGEPEAEDSGDDFLE
jgi:hypothetical protein